MAETFDSSSLFPSSLLTEKDEAYQERNRVIAVLAKLAQESGLRTWIAPHKGAGREQGYDWLIFVELPTGQVSWHIHDSELSWFTFLPRIKKDEYPLWDGHTKEEKYQRCSAYCKR